jgi:hypothetical protein
MNIAIVDSIINTIDIKNYKIANIEAGKAYKIDFDIDGHFQIQFAQQKETSNIIKPITRNLRGIVDHYSYKISTTVTGSLLLVDLSHILPGNDEWSNITNIQVEEI